MTAGSAWRAAWLLLAAWSAWMSIFPASAQAPSATYEVRRGDTLFAIARKMKHDGVSRNQMILGLYRANQAVFPGGNINLLAAGAMLTVPDKAAVGAIDPAEADRQIRELISKPSAVAAVPPPAAPVSKPVPSKVETKAPASREELAKKYREGLDHERRGDDQSALKSFLEAGEGGYGPAQKKLGEIYDKGNSAVSRDYQVALQWYQKAREQGVEIPKPFVRSPR
jgi:FimV-like protein